MSNRRLVPIALIVLASASSCGGSDGPTAPPTPTTVIITVRTTGDSADPDGYTVANLHIQPNDSVTVRGLAPGRVMFELTEVASTCRVDAPNPREVLVRQDVIARVGFAVQCARPGAVRIDAVVTGFNDPPFEFLILDRGLPAGVLRGNRPALVTGLFPGVTRLVLSHQAGFCDLAEPAIHDILVASDDTLRLSVGVHCPTDPDTAYAVLVERDRRIELLTERGTRSRMLTPPGAVDFSPVWSPDGNRIAFVSDRGGARGVYVMRWDGSGVVKLADSSDLTGLVWSPDGRTLKVRHQSGGSVRLLRTDGSGERSLALGWNPYWVSWSPDRRRFVTDRDGDIVIVDSETGSVQPITSDGGCDGAREISPSWSPAGDRIVWLSDRGIVPPRCSFICSSIPMRLWSSDGDGRSPRQLRPEFVGFPLMWSPRGALLAIGSLLGGLVVVYDPVAETLFSRPVPERPEFGSWLPDERHIVYWRDGPIGPSFEVVTDRFEGGELRVIATRLSTSGMPHVSWRPTRP